MSTTHFLVDPASINIDQILGVILICLILAAYLFGMSSSQAYIYYDRFPNDLWQYRTLVCVIWMLDAAHTGLMSHTAYYYTVTNFGNFDALDQPPVVSFNLEILLVPIIAFITQTYFAHRAWAIEKNNWPLALSIQAFTILQLIFGIIACAIAFTKFDGFLNLGAHTWALIAWLASSAAANLMITVSLVWTFWVQKTAFGEDDGWTTQILMYSVHTGLFVSVATIIDLAFVAGWPHCLAFVGMNYILGKLYTNTLFYALNRRPISDPRYQSSSQKSKSQNVSSQMPTFPPATNPHSLSAPRVRPKDPYAADFADPENNGKAYPIGGLDLPDEHNARKLDFEPDEVSDSDVNFMSPEKRRGDVEHHANAF